VIYLRVAVAENNTQRKYAIISISYIVTRTRSQPEAGVILRAQKSESFLDMHALKLL